ncbi:MAG: M48 family metallopeptidase [Ignavibacteria bacterium]|nr:M48 family metallopeptidase [Ignavibacteria bacterium]
MWELIQSNKRKSWALFLIMGSFLLFMGFLIGEFYFEGGGVFGIIISSIIWIIFSTISYFGGSSIILGISNAQEVSKKVHPQLFNIVEEMTIASNLNKMPKIYIINDVSPNAFATGRNPENSSIAVTAGLLGKLNRDELQGVVAHEMSHIVNRDVMFMTFAGVMLGAIVIISDVFLRSLWMGGGSRSRYGKKSGGGQAQLILMIVSVLFAILGPIFAQLLYFAISRKREYLADASAVRLTRYPEGLASALEKISGDVNALQKAYKATSGMYIVNPLHKQGMSVTDISSTHPPISERIRILRSITGGAAFIDYQLAYAKIKGKTEKIIPDSVISQKEKVEQKTLQNTFKIDSDPKDIQRQIGNIMMLANKYLFISCTCGLKLKIPPDFGKDSVECPKCHTINKLPENDIKVAMDIISEAEI